MTTRPAGPKGKGGFLGFALLLVPAGMAIMDANIINVVLPIVGRDLGVDSTTAQLALVAYACSFGSLLLLGGRLGDAFGSRSVFLVGVWVFTGSSALCAAAPGISWLVAGRLLQGVGAALMYPQVLAITVRVTSPPDLPRRIGAYGAVLSASGVAGLLLGGLLTSADVVGLSWRATFAINVVPGVVVLALARRFVPDPTPDRAGTRGMEAVSSLTLLAGLGLLFTGATTTTAGVGVLGAAAVVVATAGLAAWVRWQCARERDGHGVVVPLTALRRTGFLGVAVGYGLCYACAIPFFVLGALAVEDELGFSALSAALVLLPCAAAAGIGSLLGARTRARNRRHVAVGATLGAVAGLVVAAVGVLTRHTLSGFVLGGAMFGIGFGTVTVLFVNDMLTRVPVGNAGSGSGLMTTVQQVASASGTVLFGIVAALGNRGGGLAGLSTALIVMALALGVLAATLTLGRARFARDDAPRTP